MPKKKILPEIEITELILIKHVSGYKRTFFGEIRRETNADGNPLLMGKVIVQEGKIWSKASSQEELRKNLDDICTMKLDCGLQEDTGETIKIFDEDFFLN